MLLQFTNVKIYYRLIHVFGFILILLAGCTSGHNFLVESKCPVGSITNEKLLKVTIEHIVDNHPELYVVEVFLPAYWEEKKLVEIKFVSLTKPKVVAYLMLFEGVDAKKDTNAHILLGKELLQGNSCLIASYEDSKPHTLIDTAVSTLQLKE